MTVQFNLFGGNLCYVSLDSNVSLCICHCATTACHLRPLLLSAPTPAFPKPAVYASVSSSGTILKLGTKVHHDQLLTGIDSLGAVGCFALTELGYGMCSAALTLPCLLKGTSCCCHTPMQCQGNAMQYAMQ